MLPPTRPAKPSDRPLMRCPMPHCSGWICNIEGLPAERTPTRWGCGECGRTWRNDKSLFPRSRRSSGFPARAVVYKKTENGWAGVPLAEEPKDYEASVEQEPWK